MFGMNCTDQRVKKPVKIWHMMGIHDRWNGPSSHWNINRYVHVIMNSVYALTYDRFIYIYIYMYIYIFILHYITLYYFIYFIYYIILHYIILFYIILYYPGPSNVALFLLLWSFDTEIDNSIHFFHFVAQISDPSNFPEFDLLSLGYPSSTENRNCLLWCDTSSSENLRKKSRKYPQQSAKSRKFKNCNKSNWQWGRNEPPRAFFSAKSSFLQTSENPQHEQNKIDTQINVSLGGLGYYILLYYITLHYNILYHMILYYTLFYYMLFYYIHIYAILYLQMCIYIYIYIYVYIHM